MTDNKIIKIDATNKVLGRLSVEVADILRGKNKPTFSYNKPTNIKVIVYNAENIVLTGKKIDSKIYHRHTKYIGNLKTTNLKDLMRTNPALVIKKSVKGMLPKNKLQNVWLKNLSIYNKQLEK